LLAFIIMNARFPWLTLVLAGAAMTIGAMPAVAEFLQFDRTAVAAGQIWRLFTAHLTHFDANHLAWDVAVLLILGAWGERESRAQMVAALALTSPAITGAVWLSQPQFSCYRGLSGLDCALFGLLAGRLILRPEATARFVGFAAVAAVIAKSGLEVWSGTTVFAQGSGYAPVPLAHLIGAGVGALVAVMGPRLTFRRQKSGSPTLPPCRSCRSFPTPAQPACRSIR
jgi:rhomboid family GlyGly-CTERM serine protease